ncbi:MAG: enolase C-terminal domain-like protein [Brevundimonas sp.]
MALSSCPISRLDACAFTVPTDGPEADGTFGWAQTDLVVVEIAAGARTGLGYTYASHTIAPLIRETLAPLLLDREALDIGARAADIAAAVRNMGRSGMAATALSAVDCALWDLKARLLDISLADLLGAVRDDVAIYGSGGFTNYDDQRTIEQFGGWAADLGCRAFKMKVGSEPRLDPDRIAAVRRAMPHAELMMDANGALDRKQALVLARAAADLGVTWFEEPVSSDDLDGLRLLRDRAPARMEIAAGEYAYDPVYVRRMAASGAVDVMQLDVTRIEGITGFLKAAAVAESHHLPISAHTAPALHLAVGCAAPGMRHLEWFHDHARIEAMLFDGAPVPKGGRVAPDRSRAGHGLVFRRRDAQRFAVEGGGAA